MGPKSHSFLIQKWIRKPIPKVVSKNCFRIAANKWFQKSYFRMGSKMRWSQSLFPMVSYTILRSLFGGHSLPRRYRIGSIRCQFRSGEAIEEGSWSDRHIGPAGVLLCGLNTQHSQAPTTIRAPPITEGRINGA